MKNYIFIISLIFSVQLGGFSLRAFSQERHTDNCGNVRIVHRQSTGSTDTTNYATPDTTLLADETILIYYSNAAKIICDNETIFNKLHKSHSQLFKYKLEWIRYRNKYHKRYTIFINSNDAAIIYRWAKINL